MKNSLLTSLMICFAQLSNAQSLLSLAPDSAGQNDTVRVAITGSGTQFKQDTFIITLTNEDHFVFANSLDVDVKSDELMEVTFAFSYQDPPGWYDLNVRNARFQPTVNLDLKNAFRLTSRLGDEMPDIVRSTPEYARIGDTVNITVTGKATQFSQYDTNILMLLSDNTSDFTAAQTFHVINDTTIEGVFILDSTLSTGFYHIQYISNYLDVPIFIRHSRSFELLPRKGTAPEIVSVSPDMAVQGETVTLTITTFKTDYTLYPPDSIIHALHRDNTSTYILPDNSRVIDSVTLEAEYTFTENHTPGVYDYGIYINEPDFLVEKRNAFTLEKFTSSESMTSSNFRIKVYPNPAYDILFIETTEPKNLTLTLRDFGGRQLQVKKVPDTQRYQMDLSPFPAGIYFIEVTSVNHRQVQKIIKK